MELIFAVLLGVLALWSVWGAVQTARTSGIAAGGYALIAVSAVVQILNITGNVGGSYSMIVSVITTAGIVIGYVLTRRRAGTAAP